MVNEPLFRLGRIVATPGALKAIPEDQIIAAIRRHVTGDWGVLEAEDKATNDEAVIVGLRILSAYPIDPQQPCPGHGDNTLWIVTKADRSVTTALLPGGNYPVESSLWFEGRLFWPN
jgi:hypothetical protein